MITKIQILQQKYNCYILLFVYPSIKKNKTKTYLSKSM